VFVAADMALLYAMLALMTLGATALVFHDESAPARGTPPRRCPQGRC
jgi:hypothetical protein